MKKYFCAILTKFLYMWIKILLILYFNFVQCNYIFVQYINLNIKVNKIKIFKNANIIKFKKKNEIN